MGGTPPGERSLSSGVVTSVLSSALVTAVIAWPVIRAPRTMILGREIIGRHADPFTVMQQFATGGASGLYQQPLTDQIGVGLAHAVGGIAAYNVLVLASFPLTALTTYLLGRYLWRSHLAALTAALAFAFAPIHVAHAIYHVHIAQAEWIPLYLLALFGAVDRPTLWRVVLLVAAAVALVLSNDYAGLIGVIVTPVALPAYWVARRPLLRWRALLVPSAGLGAAAAAGFLCVRWAFPDLVSHPERFAFVAEDLNRYGARWWAYWLPPVYHPLFGHASQTILQHAGLALGTEEMQLCLSGSLTTLAGAAVVIAMRSKRSSGLDRTVVALAVIAAWALFASLAPPSAGCPSLSFRPACLGYAIAPMFRSYARLGFVTSLCVALLAGHTISLLARDGAVRLGSVFTRGRIRPTAARTIAGVALVGAVFELWPFPGARDVLPTSAHRQLAEQAGPVRVIDCVPWTPADWSLSWLMGKEIRSIEPPFEGCDEPQLAPKLAALGFGYLIVRTASPVPWAVSAPPHGLELVEDFPDASLYRVSAAPATVIMLELQGFSDWEHQGRERWRWMGPEGAWTILNLAPREIRVGLKVELQSFATVRHLTIEIDGRPVSTLEVPISRRQYVITPLVLAPGKHEVRFRSLEPAQRPSDLAPRSADHRPLSVDFFPWEWMDSQ